MGSKIRLPDPVVEKPVFVPSRMHKLRMLERTKPGAWDGAFKHLSIADARRLQWSSEFNLRPDQQMPRTGHTTFIQRSGRGSGKSFSAIHHVKKLSEIGRRSILLIGRTHTETYSTLVKDKFREVMPSWLYDDSCINKSEKEINLKNGCTIRWRSAENEGDNLRGGHIDACVADELAFYDKPESILAQIRFFLRKRRPDGDLYPRLIVCTTPVKTECLEKLEATPGSFTRVVPTDFNLVNLDPTYIPEMEATVAHEELMRQERFAEYISLDGLDLFQDDSFVRYEVDAILADGTINPDFRERMDEMFVSVDPSGALSEKDRGSDNIGIIVAGIEKGCGTGLAARYVVAQDATLKTSLDKAMERAGALANRWGASAILQEAVGASKGYSSKAFFTRLGIEGPWSLIPIQTGRLSKHERMGLCAPLYRNGMVTHAGHFPELIKELSYFSVGAYSGTHSPDRADALSQCLNHMHGAFRELRDGSIYMPEDAGALAEAEESGAMYGMDYPEEDHELI